MRDVDRSVALDRLVFKIDVSQRLHEAVALGNQLLQPRILRLTLPQREGAISSVFTWRSLANCSPQGSIDTERIHPLELGFVLLKFRRDRRPQRRPLFVTTELR